jgi:hypothetical protein
MDQPAYKAAGRRRPIVMITIFRANFHTWLGYEYDTAFVLVYEYFSNARAGRPQAVVGPFNYVPSWRKGVVTLSKE